MQSKELGFCSSRKVPKIKSWVGPGEKTKPFDPLEKLLNPNCPIILFLESQGNEFSPTIVTGHLKGLDMKDARIFFSMLMKILSTEMTKQEIPSLPG